MQFNGVLDQLKIYEAGKPIELVVREYGIEAKDVIKLASNENPRGCSPKVIEAVRTLVQAEPVMLPQGVRFECSREQKMAVLAVLAPLALQDIRLLEPSLEDMFFGFSG